MTKILKLLEKNSQTPRLVTPIEKKYQQYLAELSTQPTEARLKEIIEGGQF